MKAKCKKLVCVLLVAALCVSSLCIPSAADAATSLKIFTVGDYVYMTWDDTNASIIGYNGNDTEITLPTSIRGIAIKTLDSLRPTDDSVNTTLNKVTIPDEYTSVSPFATVFCVNITSVTISNKMESLGYCSIGYHYKASYDTRIQSSQKSIFDMRGYNNIRVEKNDNFTINSSASCAQLYSMRNSMTLNGGAWTIYCPTITLNTKVEIPASYERFYAQPLYKFCPTESGIYCVDSTFESNGDKDFTAPKINISNDNYQIVATDDSNPCYINEDSTDKGKATRYTYCYMEAGVTYNITRENWDGYEGERTLYDVTDLTGHPKDCSIILHKVNSDETQNGFIFKKNQSSETYTVSKYIGNEETVTIPSTYSGLPVTTIGANAFSGCGSNVKKVICPNSITSLDSYAFNTTSIQTIRIENNNCDLAIASLPGLSTSGADWTNASTTVECAKFSNAYFSSLQCNYTTSTDDFSDVAYDVKTIKENQSISGTPNKTNCYVLSRFTPTETKGYRFELNTGDDNTYIVIYDENMELIAVGDGNDTGSAFQSLRLTAGKTYYIGQSRDLGYTLTVTEETGDWGYITHSDNTVGINSYIGDATSATLPTTLSINGKDMDVSYYYSSLFLTNCNLTELTIPKGIKTLSDLYISPKTKITKIFFEDGSTTVDSSILNGLPASVNVYVPNSVTYMSDYQYYNKPKATINCGFNSDIYYYCRTNKYNVSTAGMTIDTTDRTLALDTKKQITAPGGYDGFGTFTPTESGTYQIHADFDNTTEYDNCINVCDSNFNRIHTAESTTVNGSDTYVHLTAGQTYIVWFRLAKTFDCTITKSDFSGPLYKKKADNTYSFNGYIGSETDFVIPSSISGGAVTSLSSSSFNGAQSLSSVSIPNSVTNIPENALKNCDNVTIRCGKYSTAYRYATSNNIPVDTSDYEALSPFSYSTNTDGTLCLTSYYGEDANVVIPESIGGKKVTTLGTYLFAFKEKIKSITLPESITTVKAYAFYDMNKLTSLTIPNVATMPISVIGGNYADGFTIHCGKNSIPAKLAAIKGYAVDTTAFDDCPFTYSFSSNSDGTVTLSWYLGSDETAYVPGTVMGKTVKSIASSSFRNNTTVKHIVLGEGIQSLSSYSFTNTSSLETLRLPSTLQSVAPNTQLSTSVNIMLPENSAMWDFFSEGGYPIKDTENALRASMESLKKYQSCDYTADSYQTLTSAISIASITLANEKAAKPEFDTTITALNTAKDSLVIAPTDTVKAVAKQYLSEIDSLILNDYTESSLAKLKTSKETLLTVMGDDSSTITQINECISAIGLSINTLKLASAEQELYDLSDIIFLLNTMKIDKSAYTADTYAAYETALAKAKSLLTAAAPARSEVTKATSTLRLAYINLKEVTNANTPTPVPTAAPTSSPVPSTPSTPTPSVTVLTKLANVSGMTAKKTKKKKQLNVSWKKVKQATGYVIDFSSSKNFKKYTRFITKKLSLTRKMKKSKKTYYVRIRAYGFNKNLKKIYSAAWSKKSAKTK